LHKVRNLSGYLYGNRLVENSDFRFAIRYGAQTVGRKTSWETDVWANYFLGDRWLGDKLGRYGDSKSDGWATFFRRLGCSRLGETVMGRLVSIKRNVNWPGLVKRSQEDLTVVGCRLSSHYKGTGNGKGTWHWWSLVIVTTAINPEFEDNSLRSF